MHRKHIPLASDKIIQELNVEIQRNSQLMADLTKPFISACALLEIYGISPLTYFFKGRFGRPIYMEELYFFSNVHKIINDHYDKGYGFIFDQKVLPLEYYLNNFSEKSRTIFIMMLKNYFIINNKKDLYYDIETYSTNKIFSIMLAEKKIVDNHFLANSSLLRPLIGMDRSVFEIIYLGAAFAISAFFTKFATPLTAKVFQKINTPHPEKLTERDGYFLINKFKERNANLEKFHGLMKWFTRLLTLVLATYLLITQTSPTEWNLDAGLLFTLNGLLTAASADIFNDSYEFAKTKWDNYQHTQAERKFVRQREFLKNFSPYATEYLINRESYELNFHKKQQWVTRYSVCETVTRIFVKYGVIKKGDESSFKLKLKADFIVPNDKVTKEILAEIEIELEIKRKIGLLLHQLKMLDMVLNEQSTAEDNNGFVTASDGQMVVEYYIQTHKKIDLILYEQAFPGMHIEVDEQMPSRFKMRVGRPATTIKFEELLKKIKEYDATKTAKQTDVIDIKTAGTNLAYKAVEKVAALNDSSKKISFGLFDKSSSWKGSVKAEPAMSETAPLTLYTNCSIPNGVLFTRIDEKIKPKLDSIHKDLYGRVLAASQVYAKRERGALGVKISKDSNPKIKLLGAYGDLRITGQMEINEHGQRRITFNKVEEKAHKKMERHGI